MTSSPSTLPQSSKPLFDVNTVEAQAPHRWGTPRTRRVTVPSPKIGGIGIAALKRRTGCKLLCLPGFRRLADAWEDCDFSTPEAL